MVIMRIRIYLTGSSLAMARVESVFLSLAKSSHVRGGKEEEERKEYIP